MTISDDTIRSFINKKEHSLLGEEDQRTSKKGIQVYGSVQGVVALALGVAVAIPTKEGKYVYVNKKSAQDFLAGNHFIPEKERRALQAEQVELMITGIVEQNAVRRPFHDVMKKINSGSDLLSEKELNKKDLGILMAGFNVFNLKVPDTIKSNLEMIEITHGSVVLQINTFVTELRKANHNQPINKPPLPSKQDLEFVKWLEDKEIGKK